LKLVTFEHGGGRHVGRVDGEDVVELDIPSMRAYFEAGSEARETGRRLA
jgi:hypothetical protein